MQGETRGINPLGALLAFLRNACARGSAPRTPKIDGVFRMAIYHLKVTKLSRKLGGNSVRRAAYIMHESYTDARTGATYSEKWRSGEVLNMRSWSPQGAQLDTNELWSQAELAENRKDAGVARSVILALPRELELEDQAAATWRMMEHIRTTYGVAISGAIHRDDHNPHAHLLFTTREYDDTTRTLTAKTRNLDRKNTSWKEIKAMRREWAQICNEYLSEENHVSELSLKARGITRKPNRHLGPAGFYTKKRLETLENGLKTAQNEVKRLEAALDQLDKEETPHGDIHTPGARIHPRGNRETDERNRRPTGRTTQHIMGRPRRPGEPSGKSLAGIGRSRDGYREAALRRPTMTDTVLGLIEDASGLAARWRQIRNYEAATSHRRPNEPDADDRPKE